MTAFDDRFGFARDAVTLANWRTQPFSRFGFIETREIVPTAVIACAHTTAEDASPGDGALAGFSHDENGDAVTLHDFLRQANADHFVAMKDGRIVSEWTAPHAAGHVTHLLFSITKSVTGMLAGILEADGVLDCAAPVTDYVPEATAGAYGDATVRDLLDMRVSLAFEEVYLNRDGDYDRYRRAMLWNPQRPDAPAETLANVLVSLPKAAHAHGGPFFYASPNTDMAGLVIERAAGTRYADLVSQRIWQPLGAFSDAHITVDSAGLARGAGGLCATARDLARLGEMVRTGGEGANGRVVPQAWIDDMRRSGDRQAWETGNYLELFPAGRYRSCWYQTGYDSDAFCAIGIHGQWLYVDPSAGVTIVMASSQPLPGDDALDQSCLAFFRAVSDAL